MISSLNTIWTPHLTVAAVIEQDGRFLFVEEAPDGEPVLNQPAGHVEYQERLADAVVREVAEEACRHFSPESIVGFYRWHSPRNDTTYLRVAYRGSCSAIDPALSRDPDILANPWLDLDQLRLQANHLRSPLVLRCVEDYLVGRSYPLDLVEELDMAP